MKIIVHMLKWTVNLQELTFIEKLNLGILPAFSMFHSILTKNGKLMNFLRGLIIVLFISTSIFADIKKDTVTYQSGNTTLKGYVYYNEAKKGNLPVMLVVHEWWGCNEYAQSRAEQLAGIGFLAFAVDMYGDGKVVTTSAEAGKLAGEVKGNVQMMRERINAALEYIKKRPNADLTKIGAIGYCFGGTVALELARSGAELNGVVSFHGGLATPKPEQTKNVKTKILVCHGGSDKFVPDTEVAAFRKEMDAANVDWQLIMYSGAVHAFTNPNSGNKPETGVAYNETADRRSWGTMIRFFAEVMHVKK